MQRQIAIKSQVDHSFLLVSFKLVVLISSLVFLNWRFPPINLAVQMHSPWSSLSSITPKAKGNAAKFLQILAKSDNHITR